MKVLITGSTGMIGSALVSRLIASRHRVIRLVRSSREASGDAMLWDPSAGQLDGAALEGVDAAVHLAGESIAGRWTEAKKRRIAESRVSSTRLLSEALAAVEPRPEVLVCASAVGYYGDRGNEELTEQSSPGFGFLADVVRRWEAATEPARAAGIRVVNLRSGIVLSRRGGALARMLLPFRLGLGGPIGSGRHYMSWITLDDEIGVIEHALGDERFDGPVNAVAPAPVTNREFAKTLGRVLRRPAVLPVPPIALVLLFGGQFVYEALLSSTRALPSRLDEIGYRFEHPELEQALRHVLDRAR